MLLACLAGLSFVNRATAANIVYVSDQAPGGFAGPGSGLSSDGFVNLLRNAGHNVIRFNSSDASGTALTPAELAALNTNDLVIVGRDVGSGAFTGVQGANWNRDITKPLIMMSAYLIRDNRLRWFTASNVPDGTPTRLTAVNPSDLETDYIFGGVAMETNTTVSLYDEPLDRNTSQTPDNPVAGGVVLATAGTWKVIVEFPAGTLVGGGIPLGGYRMFFAAGSREPDGGAVTVAGKENLTPTGESIYLRAVQVAIGNGVAPVDPNAPLGIATQPASVSVVENTPVSFSIVVTGAPPRTLQWQRAASEGEAFVDIEGATTSFQNSTVNLPPVTPADNGALYRVAITGTAGTIFSEAALLTVVTDTIAPTIVRSVGKWTQTNVLISFSERLTPESANFVFNYSADNGLNVETATLDATGTNVLLTTTPQIPGTVYTITISDVLDRAALPNTIAPGSTTSFTAWVASRGFLTSELFLGITGNAVSGLTAHPGFPNSPDLTGYVNISSNAPTSPGRDNYGGRLLGWIIPPVDGAYTFYIRGDDGTELRLSPTAEPDGRMAIASQTAANQPFASGASTPQNLVAGQRYFVEALWKEGTGGDYMQFAWQTPSSPDIVSIPTESLETYANPVGVSVNITQHPQSASVIENRTVAFSVAATIAPTIPAALVSYQWQKGDGAGGFTNIGAPNRSAFTTPLLQFPDDNGSQWRVIVAAPGGFAISDVATVEVADDLTPPVVVSVGSLDGFNVGVCFDEVLDDGPGLNTANDSFNYTVNGVNPLTVTVRGDNKSVILHMENAVGSAYTVNIDSVEDRAGNALSNVDTAGTSFGLLAQDIGVPGRAGSHFVCDSTTIELVGGGADIWGNADTNYWVYRAVTGDFDARVRVTSLAGQDAITKAALMVRETTNSNSRTIHLNVNPLTGRNQFEAGQRTAVGGTTASWALNATVIPANIPNAWMRTVRSGSSWSGYYSSNGVDWVLAAQTTQTYPATVLVGLGLTAHNNTLLATGAFSNFSIAQPTADLGITKLDGPDPVAPGSNVTYTIVVTNRGPDTASGVVVTDVLPAGVVFVSAATTQGNCANAGGTVTCPLGTLSADGSATITVVVTALAAGSLTNTATVASGARETNADDNSATTTTQVLAAPTITTLAFGAGTFSGSFQTENGVNYEVQFKNDLNDLNWQTLTTITGDGSVKSFSDSGGGSQRFYRMIVP